MVLQLQIIQILTDCGAVNVEASIIGQFAVHESVSFGGVWSITHIETGGLVSQYTWRHVAVNFAMWLDTFCDLSNLWFALEDGDENARDAWKFIGERRKHECFVPLKGALTVTPKRV